MDRERVVGKRRAVVRRGRKHTRALSKKREEKYFLEETLIVPYFRVLCETLNNSVLVKDLPFLRRPTSLKTLRTRETTS